MTEQQSSYFSEFIEFLIAALSGSSPLRRPQAVVSLNTQGATARSFAPDDPRRPPMPVQFEQTYLSPELYLPRQIDPVSDSPFKVSYQYPSVAGSAAPLFPMQVGRAPRMAQTPVVGYLEPVNQWKTRKDWSDKTTQYGTPCLSGIPEGMIAQWSQQGLPDTHLSRPTRFMRFGGSPQVIG